MAAGGKKKNMMIYNCCFWVLFNCVGRVTNGRLNWSEEEGMKC